MRMTIRNTQKLNKRGSEADLARIRENQRRSRERRKEYTQYLEQRLRTFERLGVAASQEIQEAGKKVARENAVLRSLLMLCGVTDEQVQEYLDSQADNTSAVDIPAVTTFRSLISPRDPSVASYNSPNSQAELDTCQARFSPSRSATKDEDEDLKTDLPFTPGHNTVGTVSETQHFGGDTGTGQFTSCEDAAAIIASQRDYPNMHDVRSELGCDFESKCMVKNMLIFEIIDKSQE